MKKKDKYLDLVRELKKLWNMKVTIVPIVIGALGTITKGLLQGREDLEMGGRVETIQTTALLRTARILRRVLETWGDLLSLKLQWKTISFTDVKNSKGVNNNNNNNNDKYVNLAKELKKLWNVKVTVVPIVIGALGSVNKCLVKRLEDLEIKGSLEKTQTTTLLRSARILRRVLETWEDLLSLRL